MDGKNSSPRRPAVSIGVPVYNGATFLPAALDSLLAQEFVDFELIISDNASSDNTQEICRGYASRDRRIRYSRNESNLGPLPNFLRAVELADGEYFMWAAHDDLWSANYIRRLLAGFGSNPDALLVAGRTIYITETGSPHAAGDSIGGPSADAPAAHEHGSELVAQLLAQHATCWFYGLYRRAEMTELKGLLEELPVWGGDVLFLMRCCLHYGVGGDNEAIIYKRIRRTTLHPPKTPRAWVAWQADFTTRILGEVVSARQPWSDRLATLFHVGLYLQRMIFKKGVPGTVKMWLRAAYQLSQARDHG